MNASDLSKYTKLKPGTMVRMVEDWSDVDAPLRLGSVLLFVEYHTQQHPKNGRVVDDRWHQVGRFLNEQGKISVIHISYFKANWRGDTKSPALELVER